MKSKSKNVYKNLFGGCLESSGAREALNPVVKEGTGCLDGLRTGCLAESRDGLPGWPKDGLPG